MSFVCKTSLINQQCNGAWFMEKTKCLHFDGAYTGTTNAISHWKLKTAELFYTFWCLLIGGSVNVFMYLFVVFCMNCLEVLSWSCFILKTTDKVTVEVSNAKCICLICLKQNRYSCVSCLSLAIFVAILTQFPALCKLQRTCARN